MSAPTSDDSSERFSLLEMDLPKAPLATVTPIKAAPAVTPVAPTVSPLTAGTALLAAATTPEALKAAAFKTTDLCVAAGITDKAHPTREALRSLYLATIVWFCLQRNWAGLSAAIEQRPTLVRPLVRPTVSPEAPVTTGDALIDTLTGIATEGASNAAGQGAGSLAGGQLAGVGFTSAAGYVTALANGVKRATADSYLQTLCTRYGYTSAICAALTVTIIPEGDLPVGAGIVHTPTGTSVADMTREQAQAHMRAQNPAAQAALKAQAEIEAQAAPLKATLLHGLVQSGRGLVVSPGRAHHGITTPATELRDALLAIGRDDLAPRIKSSVAQFGAVMGALNGNGLRSWAAKRRDAAHAGESWPADVVSRWVVGHLNGGAQLGSLGDKELVAELTREGEVRFVGGNAVLRGRVTDAFAARIAEQAYNATDLLGWFRRVLRDEFHGVEWGGFVYCPGRKEQVAPVRAFIAAVKPLLGRTIGVGEAISDEGMVEGIGESLLDEVITVEQAYATAQTAAAKREHDKAHKAGLPAEDCALAARRAVVLSDAAGTRLDELTKVASKVDGFAPMLGELTTKAIRARIATLRSTLTPLIDATSERFRNLELS